MSRPNADYILDIRTNIDQARKTIYEWGDVKILLQEIDALKEELADMTSNEQVSHECFEASQKDIETQAKEITRLKEIVSKQHEALDYVINPGKTYPAWVINAWDLGEDEAKAKETE